MWTLYFCPVVSFFLLSFFFSRLISAVIYPQFEEVRGGVERWLMAHWKAHIEFLLSVIGLLFLSITAEALQRKMCQNSLPSGGGGSVWDKISGGRGPPPVNILIPIERQLIALQLCRWHLYTVSQKRPTFDLLYNLYTHGSIATIFGTNVAEKVGNQNVLYFPTSPN